MADVHSIRDLEAVVERDQASVVLGVGELRRIIQEHQRDLADVERFRNRALRLAGALDAIGRTVDRELPAVPGVDQSRDDVVDVELAAELREAALDAIATLFEVRGIVRAVRAADLSQTEAALGRA